MDTDDRYVIRTDIKFAAMETIDVEALQRACPHDWFNQTLCKVNDSLVRLGIFKGEFHWHKHDREDEFFFVLEGRLIIDFADRTEELAPGQGIVVPMRVAHRPRAPERTLALMVEAATVSAIGDA